MMNLLERLNSWKVLIIVPTYNNEKTLRALIQSLLDSGALPLVINDGSTDGSSAILDDFADQILRIDFPVNKGKGMALRKAFKFAYASGYHYVISIDSDGQHFPEDLPLFLDKLEEFPNSLIMGARNMNQKGVPSKSSFGNKFSNFWYFVETGIRLPDTQTGYRLYPLEPLSSMRLITRRFELEVEVIVKLAWKRVPVHSVPVRVKYDPLERVSHFRPVRDFTRISILNTYLVILTLLWYLPNRLWRINWWKILKEEALKPDESPARKAWSVGAGIFFGIIPIWGFQLAVGIPFAMLTRLNKVLFVAAAHISVAPMIPIIIYLSFVCGSLFISEPVRNINLWSLELADIHKDIIQYLIGSCFLAVSAGTLGALFTYVFVSLRRRMRNKRQS